MTPKTILILLLCCLACAAAAQQRPRQEHLRTIQDSIGDWRQAHPDDPLADNIWGSSRTDACVEVQLLRADSAARSDFRRRIHDSPLIRLTGFDPDTTPFPPAPEGTVPTDDPSLRAEYAFYAPGTERIRLTIRSRSAEPLYFGDFYSVCRFRQGRWETLPLTTAWHQVLQAIGPSGNGETPPTGEYTCDFTAWLAPSLYPATFGRYRICKPVYRENPRRDLLLIAEFTITPFVPFTRFIP